MSTVYFIRHAKSSWSEYGLSDHDRPLNQRGRRDAPMMAQYLLDNGFQVEFILSSTAVRAKETAVYFQRIFDLDDSRFWTDRELYHSSPETMIHCLSQIPAEFSNVALFAHNPGMTMLANLVGTEYTDNVPTCGITVCEASKPLLNSTVDDFRMTHLLTPKTIRI